MLQRSVFLSLVSALVGCASAPRSNVPPVPAFTTETMPCEYEVIGDVRATTGAAFRSLEAFQEARDLALGREAAEIGADAVLVADMRQGRAVRREVGGAAGPPPLTTFRGEAVRFIQGTCRR